jgi:hypothetical protein
VDLIQILPMAVKHMGGVIRAFQRIGPEQAATIVNTPVKTLNLSAITPC